jgi:ABC-type nitrate/sulfonate/bicarbonate transport system substrate-binding protein
MGINSWIFLKGDKFALSHPPSSQNGWLINITAVQHVWRIVKEAGFK